MPVQAAAYVYAPQMSQHVLRSDHPMRPVRLQHTYELLEAYGAFDAGALVDPRPATLDELHTFHLPEYVDAVRTLSGGGDPALGLRYGFSDYGDNPIYAGMYEAALLSTGASVQAAELVADGQARVAFNPSGGLHHAMAGNASGFCVFDDPVIAINVLRARGLRVAYVDIDAHHGDGVQAAFYDTPNVLTISLHESGRYLFPGTGDVHEAGRGDGEGFSVNVPLFPYTTDAVHLDAFDAVVSPLVRAFEPDVLATQLGVDAYVTDPLTHLSLTSHGYVALVRRLDALARDLGAGWLAFGGGGYDVDAVARCWALAYGVMLGQDWPDEVPPAARTFLRRDRLRDAPPSPADPAVEQRTRAFAHEQVTALRELIFPRFGLDHG